MIRGSLRFLNLVLIGVLAGVVFTHVLEWRGKLALSGEGWLAVQQHLYGGYAIFGAVAELSTLALSLAMCAWLLVDRSPRAWVFLGAAVAVGGMLAIFALGLQPINIEISQLTPTTVPVGWRRLLDRWTLYHAICFALALIAFSALLVEALIPRCPSDRELQRSGR